jgi:flagellar biosynthesis/type III secretory pathway protein FliH
MELEALDQGQPGLAPIINAPQEQAAPAPPPDCGHGIEIAHLRESLTHAIAEASRARREALAASERDLVELAIAIAEQIVGRELAIDPSLLARFAKEGLDALAEPDEAVIAISPDLAAVVPREAWVAALGKLPIIDESLPRLGCEVRAKHGRVSASVGARLTAVVTSMQDEP